ncbi:Csu type fimbrial protein [Emcibacter nanhaiensis]|uniref:Spore coat protein U domain-containing protein n=1 Tax=Emcibacter nanhaiensis TaxID=1505037 RepID=A0A501PII9_9PROT|nr:spore coat U domain-containing protein [Emcibacter nanhaiensis]TPD60015.1 spore coat protein U domain-containing protein [Emcibacter nanhaiensis]
MYFQFLSVIRKWLVSLFLVWGTIDPAFANYSCSVSTTDVVFGNYSVLNPADVSSTGSLSVTCELISGATANVSYSLAIDTGVSGSFSPRTMMKGSVPLNYNLYQKQNYSIIWGDGTGGTQAMPPKKCKKLKNKTPVCQDDFVIYGLVPMGQTVESGSYGDTIIATITF